MNTTTQARESITGTRSNSALNLENPLVPELRFTSSCLVALIAQIYLEKIQLDRVLEKQDNEPDGFPDPVIGAPQNLYITAIEMASYTCLPSQRADLL